MEKSYLLEMAGSLVQPSLSATVEYEEKQEMMAADMNRIMKARRDLDNLIGEGNLSMMEDNHRNHARFLASVFKNYNPQVLVETVLWVFRAYRSHGFRIAYWPAQLDTWLEIYKVHLTTETYREIYPFYHWMIVNQATFVEESDRMVGIKDKIEH